MTKLNDLIIVIRDDVVDDFLIAGLCEMREYYRYFRPLSWCMYLKFRTRYVSFRCDEVRLQVDFGLTPRPHAADLALDPADLEDGDEYGVCSLSQLALRNLSSESKIEYFKAYLNRESNLVSGSVAAIELQTTDQDLVFIAPAATVGLEFGNRDLRDRWISEFVIDPPHAALHAKDSFEWRRDRNTQTMLPESGVL